MAKTSILKITGPYGPEGFQGDDGVERYNDEIDTPYGVLGNLYVHNEDGKVFITQADDVILVRRGFPDDWQESALVGAAMLDNPLGFTLFRMKAENGYVIYRLMDDYLRWADDFPGVESFLAKYCIGIRQESDWVSVYPPPEKRKREIITRKVRMEGPPQ
ncbi:hypothetical protein SEA_NANOSMITE_69 [Mycobacterium phage Nanosmite]|nr:hypothetical protein SEA_NANOSMITE_69 [Mycobacterium phage Nanosmite]